MAESSDTLSLGGNIELSGFKEIDGASMIIVKKMVGTYVKKFGDLCDNFESIKLTLKKVHPTEKSEKYELHAKLIDNGKAVVAEHTERNLFVTLDRVMRKIENGISE